MLNTEALGAGFAGDAALIGPIDSRVQEIRTTQFPWNTIVHLCRDFGSGRCSGCSPGSASSASRCSGRAPTTAPTAPTSRAP